MKQELHYLDQVACEKIVCQIKLQLERLFKCLTFKSTVKKAQFLAFRGIY